MKKYSCNITRTSAFKNKLNTDDTVQDKHRWWNNLVTRLENVNCWIFTIHALTKPAAAYVTVYYEQDKLLTFNFQ